LSKAQARTCQWASSERRVTLGSAVPPGQRGDVDVVAPGIVVALVEVGRPTNVALDRGVSDLKAFRDVHRRPKLGPCGVTRR
jgi:hypothetical protein